MWYRLAGSLSVLFIVASSIRADDEERLARWEKNIQAIEKRLTENPPPKSPVVFVGSSSIVRWDLDKSFPNRPAVNVGFGGSQIREATHFIPRIVTPLKPSAVVFYSGDNDVAAKRTAEQVRDDFQKFVKQVRADSPDVTIYYICIKPSIRRWDDREVQKKANGYIEEICQSDDRLYYVDIVPISLGEDGKPRADYLVKDGLHLSEAGYAAWAKVVSAALGWDEK